MNQQIKDFLAAVTIAMPAILVLAHGLKSLANRLYLHALTTPSKDDDRVVGRLVVIADWLDQIVAGIADLVTLGLTRRGPNRTPSIERVETDEREEP